jgi:hypothetical protein
MTGNEILARSRVVASQTAGDATQSPVIDSRPALRSLLNTCIRETYRAKAKDPNFIKAINVKKTIAIVASAGTLPDTVIRQFIRQASWADDNNSYISYWDYPVDANSGQNFDQLAYVQLVGDTIEYTPANSGSAYTGNLYCTTPCYPVFPASMATNIPMKDEVAEDVISLMALAIRGQVKFDLGSLTT